MEARQQEAGTGPQPPQGGGSSRVTEIHFLGDTPSVGVEMALLRHRNERWTMQGAFWGSGSASTTFPLWISKRYFMEEKALVQVSRIIGGKLLINLGNGLNSRYKQLTEDTS